MGEPLPGKGPILEVGLVSDPQQLGQGGGSAPAGGGGEREREGEHTRAARQERVQGWLGKSSTPLIHPESGLHAL